MYFVCTSHDQLENKLITVLSYCECLNEWVEQASEPKNNRRMELDVEKNIYETKGAQKLKTTFLKWKKVVKILTQCFY